MALPYFLNNLTSSSYSPKDYYKELEQAIIDESWDNSTQREVVLEQTSIGSNEYIETEVSVDIAIDITTGTKRTADFKNFSNRNLSATTPLGLMYKYLDHDWIVTDNDDDSTIIKTFQVRRCNNMARWIDPSTGCLHCIPCVINYNAMSSNPTVDKDQLTPNNKYEVIIQGNQETLKIKENQRFIFNGRPFKLIGFNNALQTDTISKQATLLHWLVELDSKLPTDDYVNCIANAKEYEYSISIDNKIMSQVQGFKGQFNANVTFNNKVVDRKIIWTSNRFATVDNFGNFTLTGEAGSIAEITCYIEGNPNIFDTTIINISDVIIPQKELIINPIYNEISEGDFIEFTTDIYIDNIKQPTDVICTASGVDSKHYNLTNIGNKFTLKNILMSKSPLTLTFTGDGLEKVIHIKLKSMF